MTESEQRGWFSQFLHREKSNIKQQIGTDTKILSSLLDKMEKAASLANQGKHRAALPYCQKAAAILERLVNKEVKEQLKISLAGMYHIQADELYRLGKHKVAIPLYEQAIAIYEPFIYREGQHESANDLALAYYFNGVSLAELGNARAAVERYDQVIALHERSPNQEQVSDIWLAQAYYSKGIALVALDAVTEAIKNYDQAIIIYKRLVKQTGLDALADLASDLAMVLNAEAGALHILGNSSAAVPLCDQAIAILEPLVNKIGRRDQSDRLDKVYKMRAICMRK